jgi:hypothetical protein
MSPAIASKDSKIELIKIKRFYLSAIFDGVRVNYRNPRHRLNTLAQNNIPIDRARSAIIDRHLGMLIIMRVHQSRTLTHSRN